MLGFDCKENTQPSFCFEPEVECLSSVDDIFCLDLTTEISNDNIYSRTAQFAQAPSSHASTRLSCADILVARQNYPSTPVNAARRPDRAAKVKQSSLQCTNIGSGAHCAEESDYFGNQTTTTVLGVSPDAIWASAPIKAERQTAACLNTASRPDQELGMKVSMMGNIEVGSGAGCSEEHRNYFWNQNFAVDPTPFGSLEDFGGFAGWKHEDASSPRLGDACSGHPLAHTPSVCASATTKAEPGPTKIKAQPKPRRQRRGRGGRMPCRKNKQALYWTVEDHEKFVAGLEQFGLQDGLGPGGAELMSVYMGDRS
eukprot:3884378-Rhodomonas_salina.1